MGFDAFDSSAMLRALELARRGEGFVEPNPMVGAVIASGASADGAGGRVIVAEGWHARHGGAHAEAAAIAAAGELARGGTLYVTLEPCCHQGKTPPCTSGIVAAGIRRVVVGAIDPFPAVNGRGLDELRAAGILVETGLHRQEAERLTAPFRRLVESGRPWLIAKWAMSLDGHVATHSGESRWISSEESRAVVHRLRGRMDAIMVGIGTALADDPLLTPRPPGPRSPLRIVLDGRARLPPEGRLVQSAHAAALMVAVGPGAPAGRCTVLESAGAEVWRCADPDPAARLESLLAELGRRRLTNVLCEGGPHLLGGLFDRGLVDEVWTFIAPRLIGGGVSAVAGRGVGLPADAARLEVEEVGRPGGDVFIRGLVRTG
ncbi:MAG: bifunctional diaminohydroxyphosphoribosylaminopyrimidine deaminase/5-amino-6-(5-phosphoribosylamino)uracil reductase RibD [Planctomycetia bacterium]|nr:bifunctional diaminohydroxyphosphoribosylaminopyrimidine deaminase/5-amino-6-(5-phosphoribosylamino)uracil reductase RibD [Planctomycetia bacterium]